MTVGREFFLCARKLGMCLVCLCVLDAVMGGLSGYAFFQQSSGKFYRIYRTMASAEAQLMVFGSSHAASHYVPEVLEDELGLSCYNAGVLGQQILFHKTLQAIVLDRVTPEVIVLDVDPGTLYEAVETYDRLADLRPFYFRYPRIIGPVLELQSPIESLFLRSRLYQYNSTLAHVVRYGLSPQPDAKGYRADYGTMIPPTFEEERDELDGTRASTVGRRLDAVMVEALERFALDARQKGAKVFYVVSPGALPYDVEENASYRAIREVAERLQVPLFDFRNHPAFMRRYDLYVDFGHLNDTGARQYSRLVAEAIRPQLRRPIRPG